jgi:hypothetical protein
VAASLLPIFYPTVGVAVIGASRSEALDRWPLLRNLVAGRLLGHGVIR